MLAEAYMMELAINKFSLWFGNKNPKYYRNVVTSTTCRVDLQKENTQAEDFFQYEGIHVAQWLS